MTGHGARWQEQPAGRRSHIIAAFTMPVRSHAFRQGVEVARYALTGHGVPAAAGNGPAQTLSAALYRAGCGGSPMRGAVADGNLEDAQTQVCRTVCTGREGSRR